MGTESGSPSPADRGPAGDLLSVYASTALSWISYVLVTVPLAFRFQALGLGIVQYGEVVAAFALGMLLTESVWGAYAFRLASRGWILGLGVAVAVVLVGVGASRTALEFAGTMTVLGGLMVFPVPLLRWRAVTARGPGARASGSARYSVGTGIGIVVGSTIAPLVYFAVGFEGLVGLAIGVWAASIAVLLPIPWSRIAPGERSVDLVQQVRRVLTSSFVAAAALVGLLYVCSTMVTNFVQYYSVGVFGGSPVEAGYVIGIARATALSSGLVLGRLVDRFGPRRFAPLGFALVAAGALGTFAASSYPAMLGATVIFSVGVGWLGAMLLPMALQPMPAELHGTTVGVFGSFEDLGLLIGPAMLGSIYASWGPRSMFLTVAAIAAAGIAGATWVGLARGPMAARPTDEPTS